MDVYSMLFMDAQVQLFHQELLYSLRLILLFINTDVSIAKMCLDTSILAKSIMGRREYIFNQMPSNRDSKLTLVFLSSITMED
jgi:hypothetical protein